MKIWASLALAVLLLTFSASGQVLRLADLNTQQIKNLDRAKTVVLMPGGTMEEHGPYLPAFTDGYMNEWWTERIAEAIAARPGWAALVFPTLPLGDGGANEIGGKIVFPGTYGVRVATLRAVYMDLATELGEQGFRWIFVVQNHGSPLHNLAIDQASDYFSDSYNGRMVNLTGLEYEDGLPRPRMSDETERLAGIDIHAGLSETSRIMFIKPQLVSAEVSKAPSYAAASFPELLQIAQKPDWPGYFSTPARATAAHGAAVMCYRTELYTKAVFQILDGKDPRTLPRYATEAMKREKDGIAAALAYDEVIRKKQSEWLRNNGIE